jgi:hypothetical protein
MAMGHGARLRSPWGATVKARHFGVRGGLVDEDDPGRIEIELPFKPRFARRVHRAAALLSGVRRPFLRVILRRLKNRHSVPMAPATPRSFSLSRSCEGVTSKDQFGMRLDPLRNGGRRPRVWASHPPRAVSWPATGARSTR